MAMLKFPTFREGSMKAAAAKRAKSREHEKGGGERESGRET